MRYFCRITTRWGKSELQRGVRNIREGRLAVTESCWNVVKSQQFPQKCDTDLLCSLAHVGLSYHCSLMWNMRNVVWVFDVCSSQVAAVKCTTRQLMAFMIWQKVNEFCTTTWENGGGCIFKHKSISIKVLLWDAECWLSCIFYGTCPNKSLSKLMQCPSYSEQFQHVENWDASHGTWISRRPGQREEMHRAGDEWVIPRFRVFHDSLC